MFNDYRELLQYEPWVDTTKLKQKRLVMKSSEKANCANFAVGLKYFTFDEFIKAIQEGHSFKRIHTYNKQFVPTRFVTIDIDDEAAQITESEIMQLQSNNCVILPSTSGNPFKWHVYIYTFTDCCSNKELRNVTKSFMDKLEAIASRPCKYDEKLVNTWGQWVYGIPQEKKAWKPLPDTFMFSYQITKTNNYECITVIPNVTEEDLVDKTNRHVIIPFRCKDVAKFLGVNEFTDKTYIINLQWQKNKIIKIGDGFRYKYGMAWVINLIAQYFKLTKKYNKIITEDDLYWNLKRLCDLYFIEGSKCNCYGQLESFLKELYNMLKDKSYETVECMMDGKIHDYRTNSRIRDLILKVRNQLRYDEKTNTFIALNRQELLKMLKEVKISEKTFKTHIYRMGYDLAYEEILPKYNKGKTKYDFSKYEVNEKGQYLVPKIEITPYFRKYACKHKLKIKGF